MMPNTETENKAWTAYANLEAAFDEAMLRVERNYQDARNWTLLKNEINGFFRDAVSYMRDAILHPDPSYYDEQENMKHD